MSGRQTDVYTHEMHAKRTVIAIYKGEPLGIKTQHVQAKLGRTICCAKVVDAWETADGREMWQLDLLGPIRGRMSLPAFNVRKCAHVDGRCTCVAVDVVPDGARGMAPAQAKRDGALTGATAQALPDGNHGEIIPESAK